MIPRSQVLRQPDAWQQELAEAITSPLELLSFVELDPGLFNLSAEAHRQFRLRVPVGFAQRMRKGQRDDPLLRQVLPIDDENTVHPGYSADPLRESDAMPTPGLLHKYRGRALLAVTGACAIHCRYCFRRHFPYAEANPARDDWRQSLDYLARHEDIREIILSGGDPLSLPDHRLAVLVRRLERIPHLTRLRIHTRVPVVLPSRVTPALLSCLSTTTLQTVIVLHINHASEIDDPVRAAVRALADTGASLLNQAVLLQGVNHSVETLHNLSEAVFSAGILPYYLHQLDPVQGTAHFAVDDRTAVRLIDQLRSSLPGYLLPRLVRERAGTAAKLPVTRDSLLPDVD